MQIQFIISQLFFLSNTSKFIKHLLILIIIILFRKNIISTKIFF